MKQTILGLDSERDFSTETVSIQSLQSLSIISIVIYSNPSNTVIFFLW